MVISGLVKEELERTQDLGSRSRLRSLLNKRKPGVIFAKSKAKTLALELLTELRRGPASLDDMTHLACAMLACVDAFCSWDTSDIAREPTRAACRRVAGRHALRAPFIGTPTEIATWLSTA